MEVSSFRKQPCLLELMLYVLKTTTTTKVMSVNRSFYYIYKVMKNRKILIKYNAYFEEAVFHIRVNIKSRISHVKKTTRFYIFIV